MRTKKAIITTALAVPMLALGGGVAYATTTGGSTPPATRTAVTTTVQSTTHNPSSHRCDYRCDWRGHRQQQPATQRHLTPKPATQHGGYGYQNGSNGYQGNGWNGNRSGWGNGSGCCRNGW